MTKDHILAEIRRTATENGGTALGRDRFFAETGIKDSDWPGKYWARWSDAVREAGHAPNTLQGGRSDADMLEALAALARELQRFPVRGELKLKRRTDPTFPDSKTYDRFGSKAELVARLLAFSKERGYEDVASLCVLPSEANNAEVPGADTDAMPVGSVYLLRSGRYYKVGRSNAVGRRERELAIQLPDKATVVHSIKTDDPPGIEDYWHRRFGDRRKNGEWFDLSAEDVAAFRRRKFM